MTKKTLEQNRKDVLKETKEQVFHRRMDQHILILKDRCRVMRKTVNAHRLTSSDADLICLTVDGIIAKFTSFVKSRAEEELDTTISIWQ